MQERIIYGTFLVHNTYVHGRTDEAFVLKIET